MSTKRCFLGRPQQRCSRLSNTGRSRALPHQEGLNLWRNPTCTLFRERNQAGHSGRRGKALKFKATLMRAHLKNR